MTDEELEAAHRSELSRMLKYWKERALRAENFLKIAYEIPEVSLHMQERMKCESDVAEVKCQKCTCWKSRQKEVINEP